MRKGGYCHRNQVLCGTHWLRREGHGSRVERLLDRQKVPGSIPRISGWKDQVVMWKTSTWDPKETLPLLSRQYWPWWTTSFSIRPFHVYVLCIYHCGKFSQPVPKGPESIDNTGLSIDTRVVSILCGFWNVKRALHMVNNFHKPAKTQTWMFTFLKSWLYSLHSSSSCGE